MVSAEREGLLARFIDSAERLSADPASSHEFRRTIGCVLYPMLAALVAIAGIAVLLLSHSTFDFLQGSMVRYLGAVLSGAGLTGAGRLEYLRRKRKRKRQRSALRLPEVKADGSGEDAGTS